MEWIARRPLVIALATIALLASGCGSQRGATPLSISLTDRAFSTAGWRVASNAVHLFAATHFRTNSGRPIANLVYLRRRSVAFAVVFPTPADAVRGTQPLHINPSAYSTRVQNVIVASMEDGPHLRTAIRHLKASS